VTKGQKMWWINAVALFGSIVLWGMAALFGWLESVAFVSHISMGALVLSAIAGLAGSDAAKEAEKSSPDTDT
jgi:hypothetical protein